MLDIKNGSGKPGLSAPVAGPGRDRPVLIVGGMGPAAGLYLHRLILEETRTNGTDGDHLEIVHLARPGAIPDRTEFILNRKGENPADRVLELLAAHGPALSGRPFVLGIPCNAFHAPVIFDALLARLGNAFPLLEVTNMATAAVAALDRDTGANAPVGLLGTLGTLRSGLYQSALRARGRVVLELPEDRQQVLMNAIYNRQWGLKAALPPDARAAEIVRSEVRALCELGAGSILLACSEFPLVLPESSFEGVPLICPTRELARALVAAAAPWKSGSYSNFSKKSL